VKGSRAVREGEGRRLERRVGEDLIFTGEGGSSSDLALRLL